MKKFRVGYFADGSWSHKALQLLLKDKSIEICFIVPRFDTKDFTLENTAALKKIDYFISQNVNSVEFIKKVKKYECDLFVSMSFNQIFRHNFINVPKYKTINCHAGKLPFYRGRNILNWALINDEKDFGITVHFVDEGIDTGDIILQQIYPITDADTYKTLLEKAYLECANVLFFAIKKIQEGTVSAIKQHEINPFGMYCGMRKCGDEIINWAQTSRDLFNFIRAICDPGPQALSFINGHEIKINKAVYFEGAPKYKGISGQVLVKTINGYLVKTIDSYIEICEISSDYKIRVGDRFENSQIKTND